MTNTDVGASDIGLEANRAGYDGPSLSAPGTAGEIDTLLRSFVGGGAIANTSNPTDTTDFDTLDTPGFQPGLYLGTGPNGPGSATYFYVQVLSYGLGQVLQIAWPYAYPVTNMYLRGRYSDSWGVWKEIPYSDQVAKLNTSPTFSSVTLNTSSPTKINLSANSLSAAYVGWQQANGTQRAYVGYGSSVNNVFDIYNADGAVNVYAWGSHAASFGTTISFNKTLYVTGTANDYGIRGTAGAGYGGVLGYSADQTKYGILGYANAYSFYGAGTLYNNGDASISGAVDAGSRIKAGTYLWAASGQVFGDTTALVLGTNGGAGYVYLRPNGVANGAGQAYVDYNGTLYASGYIYSPQYGFLHNYFALKSPSAYDIGEYCIAPGSIGPSGIGIGGAWVMRGAAVYSEVGDWGLFQRTA